LVESAGEGSGVALLFMGVVDDPQGGCLVTVTMSGRLVEGGLKPGDLLLKRVDVGNDVGAPALLCIGFSLRPLFGLAEGGGVALPPASSLLRDGLGSLEGGSGLGQITDRPPWVGVGPDASPVVEVGAGLLGYLQGLFGLAEGGGPVRQDNAVDRLTGDRSSFVEKGSDLGLLFGWQSVVALAVQSGGVR
jgi:hypothetical protein